MAGPLGIIGGPQQARLAVQVIVELALVPDVVAAGEDVQAEGEQILGDGGGDAEAPGGGFRVGAVLRVGVLGDEILVQQFLVAALLRTRLVGKWCSGTRPRDMGLYLLTFTLRYDPNDPNDLSVEGLKRRQGEQRAQASDGICRQRE